jgi:hypothetical protein
MVKVYNNANPPFKPSLQRRDVRAAWDSAAHVEKSPTKKTPPTP